MIGAVITSEFLNGASLHHLWKDCVSCMLVWWVSTNEYINYNAQASKPSDPCSCAKVTSKQVEIAQGKTGKQRFNLIKVREQCLTSPGWCVCLPAGPRSDPSSGTGVELRFWPRQG